MITPARHLKNPIDTSVYNYHTNRKPQRPFRMQVIENIRYEVQKATGFNPYVQPKVRSKEFVKARQLFIYFVLKYTKTTQSQAGAFVGKHHATVEHAINCVNTYRDIEKDYKKLFNSIDEKIKLMTQN